MFCLPETISKKEKKKGRKKIKEFPYTAEKFETMVLRKGSIPSFMATAGSQVHWNTALWRIKPSKLLFDFPAAKQCRLRKGQDFFQ